MNDFTKGLYSPDFERENCGFGLIAQMDGEPSNDIVRRSIKALSRLSHRGAVSADGKSGDGCGLLLKMHKPFFRQQAAKEEITLTENYAIGMVFLNTDEIQANKTRQAIDAEISAQGLIPAGWRDVPVNVECLGELARATLPRIQQVFVNLPEYLETEELERKLFVIRKFVEPKFQDDEMFYISSLSSRLICYKGLMMPEFLPAFYLDLADPDLETSLAVFHQRFSTNTWPSWKLAQPFRYLAHNGEINTIRGNRAWARARQYKFQSPLLPQIQEIESLVSQAGSDSQSLDNMLEVLVAGGMDIFKAMKILIPPAWQNVDTMDQNLRAFYRFYSMSIEPWDGPAGIVLTDGRYASCVMDRNGLRPARYAITHSREIVLASEAGVVDIEPENVAGKGRLGPGQMLAVDTHSGDLLLPDDVERRLKSAHPYKDWLKAHRVRLESALDEEQARSIPLNPASLKIYQKAFNLTLEEREYIIKVLANMGAEAVGSMGDDTPMAVLSKQHRSLYDYFRQQFAQVTNPPIDPLREYIVMGLETSFGGETNLFEPRAEHAARVVVDSPVLSNDKYQQILNLTDERYSWKRISLNYEPDEGIRSALKRVCSEAAEAARSGSVILILSDRDISKDRLTLHALLATGAVHHHLINSNLRCEVNIIAETATARDPHQIAALIGNGASAVFPYLAYETVLEMVRGNELKRENTTLVLRNYRKGINKGLYKIMSKMGISTVASYCGCQLFEAIGLDDEVIESCFPGTPSRIQGASFDDLEKDQMALQKQAWISRKPISTGGLLKYVHGGEYHAYNPDVIKTIHHAVEYNDFDSYQQFSRLVNRRPVATIRDLFRIKPAADPISIDEVEPVENILPRFDTAAMSLGALSPEAHEALAIAMNTTGGRSNSGEGGEDPQRYNTNKVSKIKQIASGRFGVTPEYLLSAEVLQIKIAQGAKPGEGGQLPGHKVNDLIARLRYSIPGVALISPPPHHDIYSIEDLAQLIFDLKQINPKALVSVKLVASAGVGTIAAGVAKAYADFITISGYDGGTGASPLTSVKYAGTPWEMGLAETHQTLTFNNLRGRIRLQADGGMKTGLDIIKAGILGAESFGFGTMPMVALGCKYLRVCHLNNCATGVATQDVNLRQRYFAGSPERVINYFRFVAEEVRQFMASLGIKRFDELIGNTGLIELKKGETDKHGRLDLSRIIHNPGFSRGLDQSCKVERNFPADKAELAERIVADVLPSIQTATPAEFSYDIKNINRSIGARISGEIASIHGNTALERSPIKINFTGTAGQSFGAFNAGGLHLNLTGEANDYVGKGMAGGKIVITPDQNQRLKTRDTPIIGNTCLYGATGGKLFAAGRAGERFAVRNSGAIAVVEGVGDHACEYMTGGVVVVLGKTGINFGAGMTGGLAFVLDRDRDFVDCYNHELIDIHRLTPEQVENYLDYMRGLIKDYVAETNSRWGQFVLEDFLDLVGRFWLIKPKASDLDSLLDTLLEAA